MSNLLHPTYVQMLPLIQKVRDCFKGQDHIKRQTTTYLPPKRSMLQDGLFDNIKNLDCGNGVMLNKGQKDYESYLDRAVFPEFLSDAVDNYIGLLHKKPADIDVPKEMEYLLNSISAEGETAQEFLRRINQEQLLSSRVGVLVDINAYINEPYLAFYCGESIENWADTVNKSERNFLRYVQLNETGYYFNAELRTWEDKSVYRMLEIDSAGEFTMYTADSPAVPVEGDISKTKISLKGKYFKYIPFFFANATHNRSDMEVPALLKLANKALSIYKSEADYRRSLHLQGDDTLVVIGERALGSDENEPIRTGAGAAIAVNDGGDAKFIGIGSSGLSEQREAIKADREEASLASGQFVGTNKGNNESGDAMKTRIASRTASLLTIALSGAACLENALRAIADIKGLDKTKVVVTANLDFVKGSFSAQEFIQLVTARNIGGPVSLESLHKYLKDYGITDLDLAEEIEIIKKEKPGLIKPLVLQVDKSTGKQVGTDDPVPSEAKTNVDSRP